mmetsp:Transcript_24200/g.27576  ORF Transcript_24200/g.27576 Transcript_24200/m.27576 type:complete len:85 (+) Transcript_24200:515-769(+)
MNISFFTVFSFIASSAVMGSSSDERDVLSKIDHELDELQDLVDLVEENQPKNSVCGYDPCFLDSNCCRFMECSWRFKCVDVWED